MDSRLSWFFLYEIKHQCEFAISDYNDIILGLNQLSTRKVFHSLQSFLIDVANISKIFWSEKYDERGKYLRDLLSISDTSSLKTRRHRNIFEHFDERIDEWYAESPRRSFVDMNVSDRDDMIPSPSDHMRFFNSSTFTFRFRGEKYEINPLYEEIKELLTKVNIELNKSLPI